MMPQIDADTRASIEETLRDITGVLHASFDLRSGDLWIVRDGSHETGPVEIAVRNRLASLGHDLANARIHITLPFSAGPRRRVRFVDAIRHEENNHVRVTVRLEWNDVIHSASVSGEKGPAVELKTTAQAAVDALEKLSGQSLGVRLIGIKRVHAFDSDLMVASMIRTAAKPQRLVGAVIVSDNPLNSAALSVLSGLNRVLGNFLHTTD